MAVCVCDGGSLVPVGRGTCTHLEWRAIDLQALRAVGLGQKNGGYVPPLEFLLRLYVTRCGSNYGAAHGGVWVAIIRFRIVFAI